MSLRNIELVAKPPQPHWVGDGFRVHNFIPGVLHLEMARMNPFILLDYNAKYYFPPSDTPPGVGVHPHRGFETVTIAYKGKVAHHDSSGGGGVIGEGDVQWMTAASGVLHKEYHEEEYAKEGGDFQMAQLWINLPAKYKMSKPKYQAITKEQMGIFKLEDGKSYIEIIAGEYKNVKGPASTFTPINLWNIKLLKDARLKLNLPSSYNTSILIVEGSVVVNDQEAIPLSNLVLFENNGGEEIILKADEDSLILVMSGEPIDEPIAANGPFVMNTKQEIFQAYQDFNNGKFGYLE